MNKITDFLNKPKRGRHFACPFCDSSDALDADPDEGDSGVYFCFSCGRGGTGVQLLERAFGVETKEAMHAFGIETEGMNSVLERKRWQRKKLEAEKRRERRRRTNARIIEIERAKEYMNERETVIFEYLCTRGGSLSDEVAQKIVARALNRARSERESVDESDESDVCD